MPCSPEGPPPTGSTLSPGRRERRPAARGTGPVGQFTKTAGFPLTLESVTGPYFTEKVPELGQKLPPAAFVNRWVTTAMTLPLLDATPAMDAALTEQVKVDVPSFTVAVISSGVVLVRPLILTGFPVESLTVAAYGRLPTVRLLTVTPGTPGMLILQPLKVSAVMDSLAVPGLAGLLVTFAVKLDLVQVSVPRLFLKTTDERLARLAFRIEPGATAGPPAFPLVSTWMLAAEADVAGSIATSAVATTVPT